jgi:penicillin-binding protein 1C
MTGAPGRRPPAALAGVARLARVARTAVLAALAAAGFAAHLLLVALSLVAAARARLVAPEPTVLVVDRRGEFLGELGAAADEETGYWRLEALPPRVVAATLALEDRRFRRHPGVDPVAVARAVRQNLTSGRRVSGASTVAMQVARLQSPGERGWVRKATEAATAVLLTGRYGRDAVMRHYLTLVPYGNRIRGIGYAARRYLDKPVEDLSWAEIAFLAALPQSPSRYNPYRPEGLVRAIARGRRLLDELAVRGVLSPAELELARAEIERIAPPPLPRRPPEALHALLRIGDELAARPELLPARGEPVLSATLDLELQREATWQAHHAVERFRGRGAGNAALVVLDLEDAAVLAWVGSTDYFALESAGAIDYARVERSAGSTLKPFLYGLALERGVIGPASILDDLRRGRGGVANADDRFLGPLLPRAALANSRNVPAVELLARVGPDRTWTFFRRLGLHDGGRPAEHYGLGLAIGGLPTTLERLVRASRALGAGGELLPLRFARDEPRPPAERVLTEATARRLTLFLADPSARLPSFPRLGATEYPFPVAVKTGTSSGFHDAWAVAWTRRYVAGAWVGHPDGRAMTGLTGFGTAAELLRPVVTALHRDQTDGFSDLGFPPPRGAVAARVCALSGALATEACDRVVVEWFGPDGGAPAADCAAHRLREVDVRSGRLATRETPAAFRAPASFVELPPRYAEWLAASAANAGSAGSAANAANAVHGAAPGAGHRIAILSPEDGTRLLLDPETPASLATLALSAEVDPPAPQLVWYVDGRPFEVADAPYSARWPLAAGEHVIQARLPYSQLASRPVRIRVE